MAVLADARLRIALVCHARHPIRPPFAGGLEAHNWNLARALAGRGHDVTLFASGDSDPGLALDPIVPRHAEATHPDLEHTGSDVLHAHLDQAYAAACARIEAGRFDLVHNHSLHRFVPMAARQHGWAALTTLHTPPVGGLDWFLRDSLSARHRVTAASAHQLGLWWPPGAPAFAAVVGNGIDLAAWPFQAQGDGSAAWSGRIAPDKGPHLAIDAARAAGVLLRLAGPIEDRGYFDTEIASRLGSDVSYAGALDVAALARMLGQASVFLSTPCWPEAFGLAAVEAMSCGLPVAAFDSGAVREVVGEAAGRFAAPGDVPGLARAIGTALLVDRTLPRRRVEQRFSIDAMLDGYSRQYQLVLDAAD